MGEGGGVAEEIVGGGRGRRWVETASFGAGHAHSQSARSHCDFLLTGGVVLTNLQGGRVRVPDAVVQRRRFGRIVQVVRRAEGFVRIAEVVVRVGPVDAQGRLLVAVLQMGAAASAAPTGSGGGSGRKRFAGGGATRSVDVARRRRRAVVADDVHGCRFFGDVDVVVVVVVVVVAVAFVSSGILLFLLVQLHQLPHDARLHPVEIAKMY